MESIFIKATEVSPEVNFNPEAGVFSISGWSRPESPGKFYDPILKWIDDFGEQAMKGSTMEFRIEYFNTPSARVLREILDRLDKFNKKGADIKVNWYLDDDTSKEEFEHEFAQDLSLPINFLQKS